MRTLKEIASTEAPGVPLNTLRSLLKPLVVGRWRAEGTRTYEHLYDAAGVRERIARHRARGAAVRSRRRRRKEGKRGALAEYGVPARWVRWSDLAREHDESPMALRRRLARIDAAWSNWRRGWPADALEALAELADATKTAHAVRPVVPQLRVLDGRCTYACDGRAVRLALGAPTPDTFEARLADAVARDLCPSDGLPHERAELVAMVRSVVLAQSNAAHWGRRTGRMAEEILTAVTIAAKEMRDRRCAEEELVRALRCVASFEESLVPPVALKKMLARLRGPKVDARLPAIAIASVAGLSFDRASPYVDALSRVGHERRKALLDRAEAVLDSWERAGFERRRRDLLDAIARAR